jgi:hypothetical protein
MTDETRHNPKRVIEAPRAQTCRYTIADPRDAGDLMRRVGTLITFGIPFTTRVKGPNAGGKGDWPFRGETKLEDKINARLLPVGIPTALGGH